MDRITSRFTIYLNEGMIKLPPRLVAEATKHFNFWALAYILAHGLKRTSDRDEQQLILLAVKKVASQVGCKMPTKQDILKALGAKELTKRMKLGRDVPPQYLKRIKEIFGVSGQKLLADIDVNITLVFKRLRDSRAFWSLKEEAVFVSMPGLDLGADSFRDLANYNAAMIGRRLHVALGVIEHELTHGVQDLVLRLIHHEQSDPNHDKTPFEKPANREEKNINHHLSKIEFDPLIKSSIRAFRTMVEKAGHKSDLAKTKELFNKFTTDGENRFFAALKKHDAERWKKAVKLAWGEYERKYL